MPSKLSIGSFGAEVVQLQNFLNLLPSLLPSLLPDGSFGNKTRVRTVEFQKKSFLDADGVVGQMTWAKLLELVAQFLPPGTNTPPVVPSTVDPTLAKRLEIINIARTEAEQNPTILLAAKLDGGKDFTNNKTFRRGRENLLKYFRLSAPSLTKPGTTMFNENDIKYFTELHSLAPMRHWCGIFALWAIKTAGVEVGNWVNGFGIGSVRGFTQNFKKTGELRGCVGFINNGFEHHFIIEEVFTNQFGAKLLKTIEGNSDPHSNFNFKSTRALNEVLIYSPFPITA